jgi:hypothetical protein
MNHTMDEKFTAFGLAMNHTMDEKFAASGLAMNHTMDEKFTASEKRMNDTIGVMNHTMDEKFTAMGESIDRLVGTTTELKLAERLRRQSASNEGPTMIRSLEDLANLVSPVEAKSVDGYPANLTRSLNQFKNSDNQKTEAKVKDLISSVYENRKTVKERLVRLFEVRPALAELIFETNGKRKTDGMEGKNVVEKLIIQFVRADPSTRKSIWRGSEGFGMLLLTCAATDQPTHELEFDSTPTVDRWISSKVLLICIEEFKASFGLAEKAVSQLDQRMDVLVFAAVAIYGNKIQISKKGTLLLPRSARRSTMDTLPKSKLDIELKYV